MKANLRKLQKNQRCIIHSVNAKGEVGRRIRDMGLIPGAEFQIIGRAPLFDPVALKLNGFVLTLRNSEADFIECELIEQAS